MTSGPRRSLGKCCKWRAEGAACEASTGGVPPRGPECPGPPVSPFLRGSGFEQRILLLTEGLGGWRRTKVSLRPRPAGLQRRASCPHGPSLWEGDSSTGSGRWKGRRKWAFYLHGYVHIGDLCHFRKGRVFICLFFRGTKDLSRFTMNPPGASQKLSRISPLDGREL